MSGKTRREAAKNRVGRNDRLGSDLGETKNLNSKKNQKKGEGRSKEGRGDGQRPSEPE